MWSRLRLRSRGRLAVGAVIIGFAGVIAATIALGVLLSAPVPATVGAAPPDLRAESVTFPSGSGATLAGWFIEGRRGGGAVVLMHGVRANRLSMIPRARLLSAAGFSVLLFDFQAHGESTGRHITFGHLEGLDAHAAVAFVRRHVPGERIGAIGTSLGAAAALLGPSPLPVDALILESPYTDIGSAIANRVRIVTGPGLGDMVAPSTASLFQVVLPPLLDLWPADLRPIDRIAEVAAPLLLASGTRDNHTTIAEVGAMFERARAPKLFWRVEGAGHTDLEAYAPGEYRRRVLPFMVERLRVAR